MTSTRTGAASRSFMLEARSRPGIRKARSVEASRRGTLFDHPTEPDGVPRRVGRHARDRSRGGPVSSGALRATAGNATTKRSPTPPSGKPRTERRMEPRGLAGFASPGRRGAPVEAAPRHASEGPEEKGVRAGNSRRTDDLEASIRNAAPSAGARREPGERAMRRLEDLTSSEDRVDPLSGRPFPRPAAEESPLLLDAPGRRARALDPGGTRGAGGNRSRRDRLAGGGAWFPGSSDGEKDEPRDERPGAAPDDPPAEPRARRRGGTGR